MREESELRQRVGQKLKLYLEQYLPIVEGAIDGALKVEKPNEEAEGVCGHFGTSATLYK